MARVVKKNVGDDYVHCDEEKCFTRSCGERCSENMELVTRCVNKIVLVMRSASQIKV